MAVGGAVRKLSQAQQADRHELYEASVQTAEAECTFVVDTFKQLRGRVPHVFREDFCGTAAVACQWVGQGAAFRAIGVDLDQSVLDWAEQRRRGRLPAAQKRRVRLIRADVLDVQTEAVDAVAAFNFSYWVFKSRDDLREYFRRVHDALAADGVLFLDAFGGNDAYRELRESTPQDGFTYVWQQVKYSPITGDIRCHIHFRFPDGSRIDKAFTYDWRLWSMPELIEVLKEAGFARVTVYWEGTDEDGEGNGEFTPEALGDADACWIAYLVAER